MRSKTWRLVPTLLIGVLLGVVMLTPVGAAFNPTKAKIKSIAKKEVKKASKTYYRQSAPVLVPDSDFAFGEVACPPGTEATGGGVSADGPSLVSISTPTDGTGAYVANLGAAGAGFTGWGATVIDEFGLGDLTFRVYVICQQASAVDSNYAAGSSTYRQPQAGRWTAGRVAG